MFLPSFLFPSFHYLFLSVARFARCARLRNVLKGKADVNTSMFDVDLAKRLVLHADSSYFSSHSRARVARLNDRFTRAAFRHARSFFAYYRCDIIDPYFAIRINLLFVSPSRRPRDCRLLAALTTANSIESHPSPTCFHRIWQFVDPFESGGGTLCTRAGDVNKRDSRK